MLLHRSIRTNCPAHIMVRASKDGTKLEVTSVNNEHNHEISEVRFSNLLHYVTYRMSCYDKKKDYSACRNKLKA